MEIKKMDEFILWAMVMGRRAHCYYIPASKFKTDFYEPVVFTHMHNGYGQVKTGEYCPVDFRPVRIYMPTRGRKLAVNRKLRNSRVTIVDA
jgi:hypothetical protein